MATTCTGPACTKPARSKGLCGSHLSQLHRGQPLTPIKGTHQPFRGDPYRRLSAAVLVSAHHAAARGDTAAWAFLDAGGGLYGDYLDTEPSVSERPNTRHAPLGFEEWGE